MKLFILLALIYNIKTKKPVPNNGFEISMHIINAMFDCVKGKGGRNFRRFKRSSVSYCVAG